MYTYFWQVVKLNAVFIAATMSTRDAYLNTVDVCELIKRLELSGYFYVCTSSGGSWRSVAESRATWSPIWSEVIWRIWRIWLIFPDLSLFCFRCCLRQGLRTHTEKAAGVLSQKAKRNIGKELSAGFRDPANETNKKSQAKKLNSESKAWPRVESNWGIVFFIFSFFLFFFFGPAIWGFAIWRDAGRPGSSVKNEIKRAL